jgi:hypothetical protein
MSTGYGIGSSSFSPFQTTPWGVSPFAGVGGVGIGTQHPGLVSPQYAQGPANVLGGSTQQYGSPSLQHIAALLQSLPQQLQQLQQLTYLQQQQLQQVQQVLQFAPQLVQQLQQQLSSGGFGTHQFAQPNAQSQPFANPFQTWPSAWPQGYTAQASHVM